MGQSQYRYHRCRWWGPDGIVKSADSGNSWVPVNDGLIAPDGAGRAGSAGLLVWARAKLTVSGGELYAATCESNTSRWNPATSGVYRLVENESSWAPTLTNILSFDDRIDEIYGLAISGETFYVVGRADQGTGLYRRRMGEALWTVIGLKAPVPGGQLKMSGRTVYIYAEEGLFHSIDEGDTWTDVSQNLPNWDQKIDTYNLVFVGETIYVVSGNGHFRSSDGVETCASIAAGSPDALIKIQLVDHTTL